MTDHRTPRERFYQIAGVVTLAVLLCVGWAVLLVVALVNEVERLSNSSVAQVVGAFLTLCLVAGTIYVYSVLIRNIYRRVKDGE